MSARRASDPVVLSHARMEGWLLRLPCDARALDAMLAGLGSLRRIPVPGWPATEHPLHLELWRITGGGVQLGDLDQHAWSERLGGLTGRPIGASVAFRRAAGAWSRAWTRRLSTYSELMVATPGMSIAGAPAGVHSLVLGMLTDSFVARWADMTLGFGYQKRRGSFDRTPEDDWSVRGDDGAQVMSLRAGRHADSERFPSDLDAVLERPLLGVTRGRVLVGSRLDRRLGRDGTQVRPSGASLHLAAAFFSRLLPLRLEAPPLAEGRRWGALRFSGLEASVSYPYAP
jgi:hypothetical protein